MIKGVNKRIIEINEYDSKMFEKAILFIKPNIKYYSETTLKKEAKKYLKGLEENKFTNDETRKRRRRLLVKNRLVFAVAGAFITSIIYILLNLVI